MADREGLISDPAPNLEGENISRTIVVTGAASGIGRATAEILEAQGNRVIHVDLKEGDITGDLGNRASIAEVVTEIEEISGGVIDGLVANAGVSIPSPLSLKINYFGTVALIEALLPLLAKSSEAPRVSVTSSAATLQLPCRVMTPSWLTSCSRAMKRVLLPTVRR